MAPDTVTHYVDEVVIVSRRFGWKHDDGSDGGNADVLLNLAVRAGTWPGPPDERGRFSRQFWSDSHSCVAEVMTLINVVYVFNQPAVTSFEALSSALLN
jgi:hypothetical protein